MKSNILSFFFFFCYFLLYSSSACFISALDSVDVCLFFLVFLNLFCLILQATRCESCFGPFLYLRDIIEHLDKRVKYT